MAFNGQRLKRLREDNHLTHTDLANDLGVSFAQIYRYESGKASPDSEVLDRMAELFGVSADYLLGRSNAPVGYIGIDDLSDDEKAVLSAMRQGHDMEAIQIIATHASHMSGGG